jgi:hypothetical protein
MEEQQIVSLRPNEPLCSVPGTSTQPCCGGSAHRHSIDMDVTVDGVPPALDPPTHRRRCTRALYNILTLALSTAIATHCCCCASRTVRAKRECNVCCFSARPCNEPVRWAHRQVREHENRGAHRRNTAPAALKKKGTALVGVLHSARRSDDTISPHQHVQLQLGAALQTALPRSAIAVRVTAQR